jgi:peptide chain release factor 2
LKFQTKKKNFAPILEQRKEAELLVKISNKKWIEDYDKAVEMTDELQLI